MSTARITFLFGKLSHAGPVRYLLVGAATFALDYGSLIFFHEVLGISVLFATSLSYWLAVSFNFLATRYFTFYTKRLTGTSRQAALYLLLLGINYVFTIFLMHGMTEWLGISYAIAKPTAVILQTIWNFPIYKWIIFKPAATDDKKRFGTSAGTQATKPRAEN